MKENKTFCVMPFLHLNIWPNGNLKPCCISKDITNSNVKVSSIKDAYNSDDFKNLRLDMINGVENKICSGCYDSEKINLHSYRLSQLEKYKNDIETLKELTKSNGEIDPNFKDMDLRLSNLCNLKCRGCNDDSSSSWKKELKAFTKFNNWEHQSPKQVNFSFDIDNSLIKNLNHLYFAGGEPMIMSDMYKFINKIEDKSEILFFINTNFTKVNFDLFKDNFKDFKLVQFIISCDGIGEIGEYNRTNLNWKKYIKNIDTLVNYEKKMKNINHIFQYTCSILNCFHFFEFRQFMIENKYVKSDDEIKFGFMIGPDWLSVLNYEDLKKDVIKYFEERLHLIKNGSNLSIEIQNFLNYLKEGTPSPKKQNVMLKSFITFGNEFNKTTLPKELSYINNLF